MPQEARIEVACTNAVAMARHVMQTWATKIAAARLLLLLLLQVVVASRLAEVAGARLLPGERFRR